MANNNKIKLKYFLFIGLAISAIVLLFYIYSTNISGWADNKIYDIYLRNDKTSEMSDSVVIVDIDEKSIAELGQWPWSRYINTILVENIVNAGSAVIAFDVLMAEKDRTSPSVIKNNLQNILGVDIGFTGLPEWLEDNDYLFASVLGQTNTVLGMIVTSDNATDNATLPLELNIAELQGKNSQPATTNLRTGSSLLTPILPLLQTARVGYINTETDSDGIIRRVPLVMGLELDNETIIYPNLSLMALVQAYGQDTTTVRTNDYGLSAMRIGDTEVPIDRNGMFNVRFKGGKGMFPYISASDIIFGRYKNEDLSGKIVFVGSSAWTLDIKSTPLDTYYPGVETHASIVDNILTGHFISKPTWLASVQAIAIFTTGLLLSLIFGIVSPYIMLIIAAVLLITLWFACQFAFYDGLFISPLYVALVIIIQSVVFIFIQFMNEAKQKLKIRGAFSRYVSPVVVSQIVASGVDVFKGSERTVSIMFTDIRGFTSLSEKLQPEQIVEMLNEYFTSMTALIKNNDGTIDKFIGDAIMAFWNAPLDVKNHELCAVTTAIQMQQTLIKLNEELAKKYDIQLRMGVGINTGNVYVGNMGSDELLDYTIIGDNVNVASRLEGLCSKYGVNIVVSEATKSNALDDYYYLIIDKIKVKGKTEALSVYYPIENMEANNRIDELNAYLSAYNCYLKSDFANGKIEFQKLCDKYKNNDTSTLYNIYLERCTLLESEPPTNWVGVWQYDTK